MASKRLSNKNRLIGVFIALSLGFTLVYFITKDTVMDMVLLIAIALYSYTIIIGVYDVMMAFQRGVHWRKVHAIGFLGLVVFLGCTAILFKYI